MKSLLLLTMLLWSGIAAASAEEWHEYCEMTEHVKVSGWVLESSHNTVQLNVNPETLTCGTENVRDYLGNQATLITVKLQVTSEALGTSLPLETVESIAGHKRVIDRKEACSEVTRLLAKAAAQNGRLAAVVSRELIRQDWTSEKNVDVHLIENVSVTLEESLSLNGGGAKEARGEYCSQKPQHLLLAL